MEFYTSVYEVANQILFRGYSDKHGRVKKKFDFSPTMYFPDVLFASGNPQFKSIEGIALREKIYKNCSECRKEINLHLDAENGDVYGNANFVYQWIAKYFPGDFIPFDITKIHVVTIDIEVDSENGFPDPNLAEEEITAITVWSSLENRFHSFATKEYDPSTKIVSGEVVFHQSENEELMLLEFLKWWRIDYPDIITGWNTRFFDTKYNVNRIRNILGESAMKSLSPWGKISERSVKEGPAQTESYVYEIYGIQELDYLELFKKFTLNTYGLQESYTLDFIANLVLGEGKVQFDETEDLTLLYNNNFPKFMNYNIRDVELILLMEEKLKLIYLALTIAYKSGTNYSVVLGTTAVWDTIIYRELKKDGIVPKHKSYRELGTLAGYSGGYVKEPQIGHHSWIMTFDAASLYPNTIVQYNMSPETIQNKRHSFKFSAEKENFEDLKTLEKDPRFCYAANGRMFSKDREGVFPTIVKKFYDERKIIKKQMIESEQFLEKIHEELKSRGMV